MKPKGGLFINPDKLIAQGYRDGVNDMLRMAYAAILLAANEEFGFGADRGLRLLYAVDNKITETLTSAEAVDDVYRRFKITLDFSEGVERVCQATEVK